MYVRAHLHLSTHLRMEIMSEEEEYVDLSILKQAIYVTYGCMFIIQSNVGHYPTFQHIESGKITSSTIDAKLKHRKIKENYIR